MIDNRDQRYSQILRGLRVDLADITRPCKCNFHAFSINRIVMI